LNYRIHVDQPVVIAAFRSAAEAARARAALVEEGIAAEATGRREDIERLCADAFDDGVDVVVGAMDGERAIALLERLWPDETVVDALVLDRCAGLGRTDCLCTSCRCCLAWLTADSGSDPPLAPQRPCP
jgi:hypothetical protein